MAQIWTETYDPKRHSNKMCDASHLQCVPREKYWAAPTLQEYPVYFVRVCGFAFEFHSIEQLEVCLKFFSAKVRPSSRIRFTKEDREMHWFHSVVQRWFDRLPMQLLEERRRIKIVPALEEALAMFKNKVDRGGRKIAKVSTKKV